ncbi:hypothetical protein Angca_009708 [Angiostrongylus cantonensis]|nr:hypothetical protein Angca_009708 [Angiostrongylus cantonensis]
MIGLLSNITIARDGARIPEFSFFTLKRSDLQPLIVGHITTNTEGRNATYVSKVTNEQTTIWNGRATPKSVPDCGFKGCPPSVLVAYGGYIFSAIGIAILLVALTIIVISYAMRSRARERERLDALWRISFITLRKVTAEQNSFMSTVSEGKTSDLRNETDRMCYFYYGKNPLMAFKHQGILKLEGRIKEEFRKMRQLEHDNLNRFIGVSSDGVLTYSLWKFCSRGTLQDVITRGSLPMDIVFIESILFDLTAGISFIHNSFLKKHGRLSSLVCVVDDRWQTKISYYGLSHLKEIDNRSKSDLLWTAPEIIRGEADPLGTQEGDIYSFAIIASELITQKAAWDLENRNETAEEVVEQVAQILEVPVRPGLEQRRQIDVPATLVDLIQQCWAENPNRRLSIKRVRELLGSLRSGKQHNLMDHVMITLENYASSLETEVEERLLELKEEKKKCDILLYRMLPKQVAERLKLGENVEPESYDSVTVFFSDVVGFTTIASRGSPMQVETIGDGYLCVSGLPIRNGLQHIKEICDLSLELVAGLRNFRVPYLPSEKVNIRVGIHSGPVVAGVVGLKMPRYGLFGDTVNTASRMESSGKPACVHMSSNACELLNNTHNGYITEPRGEIIIKGKGTMQTYWLLGHEFGIDIRSPSTKEVMAAI